MKMNKDIRFSYYPGAIKLSKCIGTVSLEKFIDAHKNPTKKIEDIISYIIAADVLNDKETKRSLKQQLFSFTPSVYIKKYSRRKYENIDHWTGLMQLDFDKLTDEDEAEDLKHHLFKNYRHVVCAYFSPSKKGVKALMKIKVPKDKFQYKRIHKSIMMEMEQYDCFDSATTNAMLPLFLSVDRDILSRDISECYTWNDECREEIDYVELNDEESDNEPQPLQYTSSETDYSKTLRIFTNKIESIVSDGHTQLRSASLILGSRCGAGYISESEAKLIAESLVNRNSYLQKDLENYKRTASWAITEGIKNPKYYK